MKNIEEFSGKGSGEWTSRQKKRYNKKSNRTRQKNMRGDSKVESNDSPAIADIGETSDIPGLPSVELQQYFEEEENRQPRANF